jgi:hypothetical protein
MLFLIWFVTQVDRFFMITNNHLEMADFTNLLFFGIPFLILLISKYIDKDRIGNNSSTQEQVPTPSVNQPQAITPQT